MFERLTFLFSVQLNWHKDDRDGRFLLRSLTPEPCTNMKPENRGFQRSLSVRMKKMFSKQEKVKDRGRNSPNPKIVRKLSVSSSDSVPGLKRSMTNPDSVIERRRLQRPMTAPSPLVINNNFSQEQNESPNSAILVKIHSELPNRNIPLLVIRFESFFDFTIEFGWDCWLQVKVLFNTCLLSNGIFFFFKIDH